MELFSTDKDLLEKFHIEAPCTLESAVERTYRDLRECNDFCFIKVVDDSKTVGYFGIEEKDNKEFLVGFFISPEYRNKKEDFFRLVNNCFDGEYHTAVYNKNTRAKKFLSKFSEPIEYKDISIFKISNN